MMDTIPVGIKMESQRTEAQLAGKLMRNQDDLNEEAYLSMAMAVENSEQEGSVL